MYEQLCLREIGRGHTSLEKLWRILNLPEPPHATTVSDRQKNIVDIYNNVASQSMIYAANKIEGTYQGWKWNMWHHCFMWWNMTGGYDSLNGIVTAILVDTEKYIIKYIRKM